MPRVALISNLTRAFDAQADPRNVAMIRRRHAFWAELARLHGWDLTVCDAASFDAPLGVPGSVSWIDLPMLPRATSSTVFARVTAAGAACVLDPPTRWSGSSASIDLIPSSVSLRQMIAGGALLPRPSEAIRRRSIDAPCPSR